MNYSFLKNNFMKNHRPTFFKIKNFEILLFYINVLIFLFSNIYLKFVKRTLHNQKFFNKNVLYDLLI